MSWFKRRPRLKEPAAYHPVVTSPASERVMQEAKKKVQEKTPKKKKD
jgi:hypothetical protein